MKAAVLHQPDAAPSYEDFAEPVLRPGELVGRVLAAGLHPLVRGQARGQHYSSTRQYPLVPGVDCVAELPDGRRVYTGFVAPPYGTFAERVAVNPRALDLPAGLEPAKVAGMMNPAMSGWLAMRCRAKLVAGETVMVLGATGSSGRLAVQLARTLGASRVLGVGRDRARVAKLPVDAALTFDECASEIESVDVILDYVWGTPAITVLKTKRGPRRLRHVLIGSSAGADVVFPTEVLRSANVELLGSGLGSVPMPDIIAELPRLLATLPGLGFEIARVPLSTISDAWARPSEDRIVVEP